MRTLALIALLSLFVSCSEWSRYKQEFEHLGHTKPTAKSSSTHLMKPDSIPRAQKSVKQYLSSGAYEQQIEKVSAAAKKYIDQHIQLSVSKHVAMVFDVDETALSNRAWIEKNLLSSPFAKGVDSQTITEWQKEGKDKAIFPILSLYKLAQDKGIEVFFISERPESMREITELNLLKQGFNQHHTLVLKPSDSSLSNLSFKSDERRKISQKGYRILVTIGDQESDLEGGYSERGYKLPNPFYED